MKKFFLIIILFSNIFFAQDKIVSAFPKFNIGIAGGISAGLRLNASILIKNHFSTEMGIGKDVRNFIGLSDDQNRYSIALNYHFDEAGFSTGLITTYVEQPGSVYKGILISPTLGFLPFYKYGLQLFIRGGIEIEVIESFATKKWKFKDIGPNLDAGIIWVF